MQQLTVIDFNDDALIDKIVDKLMSRMNKTSLSDEDTLLDPKEACEYLKIKCKSGNYSSAIRTRTDPKRHKYPLKATKGVGSTHLYRVKDLDEFKQNNYK